MALSIGTEAPDFALCFKGDDGIKIARLSDSYGKTNTVLLFFPMAFTSVCSAEMCDISKGLEEYPNATVYGISGDSPFSLDAWAKKENIKIPLLSDYDHAVAKAYDVVYESFLPQLNLIMWEWQNARHSSSIGVVLFDTPKALTTRETCRILKR